MRWKAGVDEVERNQMWRVMTSCLVFCFCSAGCKQEQVPQSEPQATNSGQQAFNDSAVADPNRFVGRDGIAEARKAIAAGEPPKLYMHIFNGVAPGWATPGIAYCQPWSDEVVSFEDIPELAWSEGVAPYPEPPNARSFATDFNTTMFEAHEREIKMVCPDAEIT